MEVWDEMGVTGRVWGGRGDDKMDPIGVAGAVPAGWWLGSPPAARGVGSRSRAGAPGAFPVRFVLAELSYPARRRGWREL